MRAGPGIGPADRIGPSNGRDHRTTGCKNSGSRNSFALANDLLPAPAPTPAAAEAAAAANKPHDEQEYRLLVVLICLGAILQRVLPPAGINWLVEVGGAKYKTDWRVFDCIAIGMRFVSSPSRTNYSVRRSSTVQSTKCEDRRRAALHLSASRFAQPFRELRLHPQPWTGAQPAARKLLPHTIVDSRLPFAVGR
jgi:hypothetical protein